MHWLDPLTLPSLDTQIPTLTSNQVYRIRNPIHEIIEEEERLQHWQRVLLRYLPRYHPNESQPKFYALIQFKHQSQLASPQEETILVLAVLAHTRTCARDSAPRVCEDKFPL